MRPRPEPLLATGLIIALLESAMIWWRIQAAPLFWIDLIWCAATLLMFVRARARLARLAWINAAAVIAALGLCEGLLWLGMPRNPYAQPPGTVMAGTFARHGYFIAMPAAGIGYRPRAGHAATSIRTVGGQLAYAVTYHVDADGLRVGPPPGPDAPRACLLMFGDSMAWGEGLEDGETSAYQLGLLGRGRLWVRNFAFTGYSAHQMLWMIRSGEVAAKAHCPPGLPVMAVYQTLPNNVARVAGLRGWDDYGPRYRLVGGRLVYAGGFDAGDSILNDSMVVPAMLAAPLSRSIVYSRVLGRDRPANAYDLQRFSAVVGAAAGGLRALYPHLEFLAIVWPDFNDADGVYQAKLHAMIASLRRQPHVRAIAIDDLQPGFDRARATYLIALDGHPNALMQRRLAMALLARVPLLTRAVGPQE